MNKLRNIYSKILTALTLLAATACVQEEFEHNDDLGDGKAEVSLEVEFKTFNAVSLDTKVTGDVITHIENLWVLVYDENGDLIKSVSKYFTPSSNMSVTETQIGNENQDGICKATLKMMLPFGKYRMVAVANSPGLDPFNKAYTLEKLAKISFPEWNSDNVAANNYMSGWFSTDDDISKVGETPELLDISSTEVNLHCWMRRAASKVTVSFDSTNLLDNITIYIESIQIKDIPKYGPMILNNSRVLSRDSEGNAIIGSDSLIQGQKLKFYHTERPTDIYIDPSEFYDESAVALTNGRNGYTEKYPNPHAANAEYSLFFYENMQGEGKSKAQIVPGAEDSTAPTYPDGTDPNNEYYKDVKPGGTYVEVNAFYVSTIPGNIGQGPIVYRFMLGKDASTNYDAERNYHYKLTLKFNGYANDGDWHLEYEKEIKRGVYVPHIWLSYLYNQPSIGNGATEQGTPSYWEKCYPVRITGNVDETKPLEVRIIESNWFAEGAKGKKDEFGDPIYYEGTVKTFEYTTATQDFYKPKLKASVDSTSIWSGFFSLYVPAGDTEICSNCGRYSAGEYVYWYGKGQKPYYIGAVDANHNVNLSKTYTPIPKAKMYDYGLGYRAYDISKTGVVYDKEFGYYKVEKKGSGLNKEIVVYIPIFTRALEINGKKAFSGGNPYFSYQRTGKIRASATFFKTDSDKEVLSYEANVTQVRRIINPKLILRSHDNASSFHVTLMHRTGETQSDNFTPFDSDGPWRATLISNDGGWKLIGSIGGVVNGKGGTRISFTVKPTSTIGITETRCAIVKVEYHNYHCVHYVHLRQGYAPIQLENGKGPYWHTFNLAYANGTTPVLSNCPLEEGGMFTYGNYTRAIDPINNIDAAASVTDPLFKPGFTVPTRFGSISTIGKTNLLLSPVQPSTNAGAQSKGTWANVQSGSSNTNHFPTFKLGGTELRVPEWNDYNTIIFNNSNVEYGFGLAFADGADNNYIDSGDDIAAFRHTWFTNPDLAGSNWTNTSLWKADKVKAFGMRVCVVYDINSYNVIHLPIGFSGYGRRKRDGGSLRYGDFTSLGQGRPYLAPMLNNLYTQYGAVYWINKNDDNSLTSPSDGYVKGMDLNYSSYDFGPFFNQNLFGSATSGSTSDAVFVRLVQSKPLSEAQYKVHDFWDSLCWNDRGNYPE